MDLGRWQGMCAWSCLRDIEDKGDQDLLLGWQDIPDGLRS